MAWCRTDETGRVEEVTLSDPEGRFHPSIVWYACPDDTLQNAIRSRLGKITNPVVFPQDPTDPQPVSTDPTIAYRTTLTPPEFMLQFTSAERIGIRQARAYSGDAQGLQQARLIIDDWFSIIEDPRLTAVDLARADTQAGVRYLVGLEILTGDRADEVLRGLPA